MVVLDQFYQVVEAETSKVSPLWKIAHMTLCIVAAVSAFMTAFTFGRILADFSYNCVLNANLVFDNNTFLNISNGERNTSIRAIDLTESQWGPSSGCSFAQFTPLVIMISSLIWGTYFGMMSKGGAGYATNVLSRPWSIVYPCIFFTSIFFIVYVISTQNLKNGLAQFCKEFAPELNNTDCVPEIDIYVSQFHDDTRSILLQFYSNMVVAVVSANIGIWSWVSQLILCLIRVCCIPDFNIQVVTVISKEEEKLESIVNLAELEDIDEASDGV